MLIEAARSFGANGSRSMVKYSICMCNYNMADTLERSLTSILDNVDERFEVVLVDDGSSDNSADIVSALQDRYSNLRLVKLKRDPARRLGLTRNISIENAAGEYVMLHLDCDDVFGPYLRDFVEVFHRIEECVARDVIVSGQHINMARRQFLLSYGPYRNLYRGEDRDLWSRLASVDSYIPLHHVDFVTRLPKGRLQQTRKTAIDTFDHMRNDFRGGVSLTDYVRYELKKQKDFSLRLAIFRWLVIAPAWLLSRFDEPLDDEPGVGSKGSFQDHRRLKGGTFAEVMNKYGGDPDLSFLRLEARRIFSI